MKHMNKRKFGTVINSSTLRTVRGEGAGGEGNDGGEDDDAPDAGALAAQLEEMKQGMEALKQENERLTAKHTEAEKHRKAKEKEAREAAEAAARSSGDIETLETSYKEKIGNMQTEWDAEKQKYVSTIEELTVGAAAESLAAKLAVEGSAAVLVPHIRSRLKMEYDSNGKTIVKVVKDGKPSAMSMEDLEMEFKNNAAFATVVKGSNASGGGGGNQKNSDAKVMRRAAYDKLDPVEQAAFIRGGGRLQD